jgi:hypothetical protein
LAPSCYPLGTLTYANVGTHSVDLSWPLVDANQSAWQVQYATDENFTEGVNTVVANAHENYTLAELTPEVHYWVRVRAKCGDEDFGEWSNVVDFTTGIACPAPTDLTLDAYNTESLTISWTETGEATAWKVAYKETESAGDFTDVAVDENPYTITGLNDGTLYTVKVRANCGNVNGLSQWSATEDFQTEASCPAPTNLAVTENSETPHGATITWSGNSDNDSYTVEYAESPLAGLATLLNEGFEGGSMPTGWSHTGSTWTVGSGSGNNSGVSTAANGTYNATFYSSSATPEYLITPAINMEGMLSATLTFNYVNPAWSGGIYSLTVYYRVGEGAWQELETYNTAQASWTQKTINLTGLADNYQIGFYAAKYNNDYGYGTGIDDVKITAEYTPSYTWNELATNVTSPYEITTLDPETQYVVRVKGVCGSTPSPASNIVGFTTLEACGAPTAFVLGAVEAHQATFSWTAGIANTAWKVYVKEHGAAEYPVAYTNATTASVTISSLDDATAYDVKIVPTCNESKILEVENAFTTLCEAISAVGYTENFDLMSASTVYTPNAYIMPECWSYINNCTNNSYKYYPVVSSYNSNSSAYSGTNYLRLYSFYSSYTDYGPQPQYAILPEMNGLAGTQITLMARGYNANSTFKIGTMTDPADASTFNPIEIASGVYEQALTTSYQEFEYIIPADAQGNYLAFMIDAATSERTSNGIYIDDIQIAEAPSCLKPTDLTFESATTTTATLSWTNGDANQTAWQICLNGDEENLVMANSNPFTIEGLTAATAYTAKVRAYCAAEDQSDWSNDVNFTTLCDAVTTFPWTEDFNSLTENYTIPVCWDNEEGTTTTANYKWCYSSNNGNGNCNGTGHNGSNCVRFNSYNNSNNLTNFLKSPVLSLPAGQPMQLKFWYKNPAGGDFSVYISTDGGTTHETALATGLTGKSGWTGHEAIDLSAYADQDVVIVFKGTSNYGNGDAYIYLDDVTVEPLTIEKVVDLNKWYAISSPMDAPSVLDVTNLITGVYDLFRYDEPTGTWQNYKASNFDFENGRGYIYRRTTPAILTFNGTPNVSGVSYNLTASCTDATLKGFNLVGNPYPTKAGISTSCYTLNANGTWTVHESYEIEMTEGVMVHTNSATELQFTAISSKSAPTATEALAITVSGNGYEDIVYARLEDGEGMPKLGHLNADAPALSIPVDGSRYAIAMLGTETESFPLTLQAAAGTYTIGIKGSDNMSYVHLLDRATGRDIDLMSQTYTFSATGSDANRFMVKLSPYTNEPANGTFAVWNGNGWRIEGDGTLQVYDVMGRKLFARELSEFDGYLPVQIFPATGVYVIRLGEKSQKIVVK